MRAVYKIIIVAFVVWHMFAVAFYSIPREAKDAFSQWTRADILPMISPYMYITSQWQLWNIFSPDPLRRVTTYRMEVRESNTWRELVTIGPDSYSFFRHATRMKLMGNMLDEFADNRRPIAGRYLMLLCEEHGIEAGTPVRLHYDAYVLPLLTKPETPQWWSTWQRAYESRVGFTITCP